MSALSKASHNHAKAEQITVILSYVVTTECLIVLVQRMENVVPTALLSGSSSFTSLLVMDLILLKRQRGHFEL